MQNVITFRRGTGLGMSAWKRSAETTRVFMVLHSNVHEEFIRHEERMKLSKRFRETVSQLSESDVRKGELRRFYRKHSEFFNSEVGENKPVELYVPKELPAFLYNLSFFVLDQGNVSLLSRVLMYHYAVRNKWLKAPPENTGRAVRLPSSGGPGRAMPIGPLSDRRTDRKRPALSVDTLFSGHPSTKRDLEALALKLQLGQSAAIRYLIEQCAIGNTPEKVRRFYNTKWKNVDAEVNEIVRIRYRNTRKLDAQLEELAYEIVGESNRSLTLRTMIAYCAFQFGIRKR